MDRIKGTSGHNLAQWDAWRRRHGHAIEGAPCRDADVAHPVTAMMIGRLDAEDEIAIPYYENIPIRR